MESCVIKFSASLGQAGRCEIWHRQQVGFPLNQADFHAIEPGLRPVVDHFRERPVRAADGREACAKHRKAASGTVELVR